MWNMNDLYPVLLLFLGVSIAVAFIALCDKISKRFDYKWNSFYNFLGLIGFAVIIAITFEVSFGVKLSYIWREISLHLF